MPASEKKKVPMRRSIRFIRAFATSTVRINQFCSCARELRNMKEKKQKIHLGEFCVIHFLCCCGSGSDRAILSITWHTEWVDDDCSHLQWIEFYLILFFFFFSFHSPAVVLFLWSFFNCNLLFLYSVHLYCVGIAYGVKRNSGGGGRDDDDDELNRFCAIDDHNVINAKRLKEKWLTAHTQTHTHDDEHMYIYLLLIFGCWVLCCRRGFSHDM